MSTIGRIAAEAGIIVVETMLVTAANYVTNTCLDMYAHPDVRNCKTDEEKAEKIKNFEKTMGVVKPVLNVVEAGIIGAGAGIAIEAIDHRGAAAATASENKESSEEQTTTSSLIGCNYLI